MSGQIERAEEVADLLLKIADASWGDGSRWSETGAMEIEAGVPRLVEHPIFKKHNLDGKDVVIIATLFARYLEDGEGMEAGEILRRIEEEKKSVFLGIDRVGRLRDIGILETIGESDRERLEYGSEEESTAPLFRASLTLSAAFIAGLYGGAEVMPHSPLKPYKDNLEYLADQFDRIKLLVNESGALMPGLPISRRARRRRTAGVDRAQGGKGVAEMERRIAGRLEVTERSFPFEEFRKRTKLSRKEELVLLLLLENEIASGGHYDIEDMLDIISSTTYDKLVDRTLFDREGRLIKEKVIEKVSRHRLFGREEFIKLNNNLKARFLEKKGSRRRAALKDDDFFEVVKPSVSMEQVILHPATREDIGAVIEMIRGNTAGVLHEWGVNGSNLTRPSSGRKGRHSVTMLYHGAPGTGKTLTAHAVAHALKSRLLTFDCSRILSCWVGESEKSTRRIFDRYRELSKGMKIPPVLLLNEADQFLHRRINATRSVENMHNQMQNIFLEQLEQFEGLLIATTNLVENLDPAFSRRFDYKICFRRPGPGERLKLWQIHMPRKVPMDEDVDIDFLAEYYDLSGGQIAVVIRNAATRAARRGDKMYQEDLLKACNDEIAGNFDEKARGRMGFC
ncbi:MAG: ATP-binding protein [Thermodesulfobacteriota bacterium]